MALFDSPYDDAQDYQPLPNKAAKLAAVVAGGLPAAANATGNGAAPAASGGLFNSGAPAVPASTAVDPNSIAAPDVGQSAPSALAAFLNIIKPQQAQPA